MSLAAASPDLCWALGFVVMGSGVSGLGNATEHAPHGHATR